MKVMFIEASVQEKNLAGKWIKTSLDRDCDSNFLSSVYQYDDLRIELTYKVGSRVRRRKTY